MCGNWRRKYLSRESARLLSIRRNDDSRCLVLTIVGGHALRRGEVQTLVQKGPLIFFSGKLLLANNPRPTQITTFTFHGFSFFLVNCFISLNFTGFDWLIERGYRPNCRNHCRQAEKAETTTCFSICERRSPLAREILLWKQRRTYHRRVP